MHNRERPQLLFDPVSGAPTHLINGVKPPAQDQNGGMDDHTYSIAVSVL